MMVILAPQYIDVQCDARRDSKRGKDVREHLGGEIADFFPLKAKVGSTVWTRTDVDDRTRESLDVTVVRNSTGSRTRHRTEADKAYGPHPEEQTLFRTAGFLVPPLAPP